jgi:acyl-coenzyme A thioesterase PaaI-like protein
MPKPASLKPSSRESPSSPIQWGVGRVLRKGKDVCYLAGELSQNGELVATATATALIRKM